MSEVNNDTAGFGIFLERVKSSRKNSGWENYQYRSLPSSQGIDAEKYARQDRDRIEDWQMLEEGVKEGIVPAGILFTDHVMPEDALWKLGRHVTSEIRLSRSSGLRYLLAAPAIIFHNHQIEQLEKRFSNPMTTPLAEFALRNFPLYRPNRKQN